MKKKNVANGKANASPGSVAKTKVKQIEKMVAVTLRDGSKVQRAVEGGNIKELLHNLAVKAKDYKGNKRFVTAINAGIDIDFIGNKKPKLKFEQKRKHLKHFIANCNAVFEKVRHIDIMVYLKLKYTRKQVADFLNTSAENLRTLISEIFEILGVSSEYQAIAVLDIK